MQQKLDTQIEFARMLLRYCQTVRKTEKRPELAMEAAAREAQIRDEIAAAEADQSKAVTP